MEKKKGIVVGFYTLSVSQNQNHQESSPSYRPSLFQRADRALADPSEASLASLSRRSDGGQFG